MKALLAPLIALFGIELASLRQKIERQAILYGLMGAFALICVIFLLVAANSALTQTVGPVVAPMIIAGAALLLALIVLLISQTMNSAEAKREEEERKRAERNAMVTSAAAGALPALLSATVVREVGIPAVAAFAAAFLLNRRKKPD